MKLFSNSILGLVTGAALTLGFHITGLGSNMAETNFTVDAERSQPLSAERNDGLNLFDLNAESAENGSLKLKLNDLQLPNTLRAREAEVNW